MKKHVLLASALLMPAFAIAQEKKPTANITGFLALDIFKWVKKEGSREEMNIGIGTINVDARARNGGTSLKIKLDLDGALGSRNTIFEEATITQEVAEGLSFTAGKGVVPFHQKHYGVIKDSYVDGGTVVGNYYWNYGDQDRRYLLGVTTRFENIKNSTTFFAEAAYEPTKAWTFDADEEELTNAASREDVYEDNKGFDPRKHHGFANKTEVQITNELKVAFAGLYSWNKINPHDNYAVVTSGIYEIPNVLEAWCEVQYGHSSSYRRGFKEKEEVVAQLGADVYLTPLFSVLANAETANFAFKKLKSGSYIPVEGVLSKIEAGVATHFSEKATWTNGFLYEVGEVKENGITKTTGRTGQQFTSTFTFSF
jgi:hypothetical protein